MKSVRQAILLKDNQAISKLTFHLFEALDLDKKGSGGGHFDYILRTMEALVGELAAIEGEAKQSSTEAMEIEDESEDAHRRVQN